MLAGVGGVVGWWSECGVGGGSGEGRGGGAVGQAEDGVAAALDGRGGGDLVVKGLVQRVEPVA